MSEEDENHEWQFRVVYRQNGKWWDVPVDPCAERERISFYCHHCASEVILQRRRKRDHLDPTPCEGIEHPVWRDWEASPDAEIQAVLVRKGMPFRSLEK
jgi:hypothetical protein